MNNIVKGLYIHIPFCKTICSYCDFYKMKAKEEVKEKYIKSLIMELKQKKDYFSDLETIYIGGGTPSSLNLNLLEELLINLHQYIKFKNIKEFTLEANPDDINDERAKLFNKYKINRISLGVQSLNPSRLKILHRTHQLKTVQQALKILHQNNIYNINADYIYGLNGDNLDIIKQDLDNLLELEFTHISAYSLILEQKTLLYHLYKQGLYQELNDNITSDLYNLICKKLKLQGFKQYEIANFAKKGMNCLHNLIYWNNEHYIALGASASYYLGNIRYTNEFNLERYHQAIVNEKMTYFEKTLLTIQDQMSEELILGLRKIKGISINKFYDKFKRMPWEAFSIIEDLINKKLLIKNNNYLYIPKNNLFISNQILINFV